MYKTTTVSCILVLSLLAACSDKPAPTVQPTAAVPPAPAKPIAPPSTADKVDEILLRAVFGKHYRPASKNALASLPDPDDRSATGEYVVTAVANTVLKTGETVLVVNAEQANAAGEAESAHASSGLLSVYLLRQSAGQWNIIKRHENVAALGSHGQIGTVVWTMLGKDKPGLAVLNGGTWQGNSIESLALFDLGAANLRDLVAEGIAMHSDNEGACDPDGTTECWSITGKWRFAAPKAPADYDDLLIDFAGEQSQRPANAEGEPSGPRTTDKVSGAARYAYDGKQYRLVDGANLVPGI
jgi:hypothetical protein